MELLKNPIIQNVFILLVVLSLSRSTFGKDSNHPSAEYYEKLDADASSSASDSEECKAPITYHVDCKLNGVSIILSHDKRNGEFYIEGYSKDPKCRKIFTPSSTVSSLNISFDECGLKRSSLVQWNITVLPRKFMLHKAETVPMNCPYPEHNSIVSNRVPPSEAVYKHDHVTNGTESSKPTYNLTVTLIDNNKMNSVIEIHPKVGGARAENCYLVNDLNETYNLTNDRGCPIDNSLFPGWKWNSNSSTLTARSKALSMRSGQTKLHCHVVSCIDSTCVARCPKEDSPRRKCKENSH